MRQADAEPENTRDVSPSAAGRNTYSRTTYALSAEGLGSNRSKSGPGGRRNDRLGGLQPLRRGVTWRLRALFSRADEAKDLVSYGDRREARADVERERGGRRRDRDAGRGNGRPSPERNRTAARGHRSRRRKTHSDRPQTFSRTARRAARAPYLPRRPD